MSDHRNFLQKVGTANDVPKAEPREWSATADEIVAALDAKRRAELPGEIDKAVRMVCDLASKGGKAFRMCIPPEPDDTDIFLVKTLKDCKVALEAAEKKIAELEAAAVRVKETEALLIETSRLLDNWVSADKGLQAVQADTALTDFWGRLLKLGYDYGEYAPPEAEAERAVQRAQMEREHTAAQNAAHAAVPNSLSALRSQREEGEKA